MQPSECRGASRWFRICSVVFVAVLAGATSHPSASSRTPGLSKPDTETRRRIADAYGRQPLGFEANRGQTDAEVQFVSRGAGYTLFLTATEAVLTLRAASPDTAPSTSSTTLRMKLVDGNPMPRVSQSGELVEKSNYITGSDRRHWHTDIPRYANVTYHDVYPGVDLVYYGNQRQLEYDFIVSPGADPDDIELTFDGAENIHVDEAGDLVLGRGDSEVRLKKPVMYQETDGHRVEIPGGYRTTASDRVAFNLGPYDSTKPLVVDPVLVYSTYLGGSDRDLALGIAIDYQGFPYVSGYANSVDFPALGARQPACAVAVAIEGHQPCEDAFITKIGFYSTYLGGTSGDIATGVAVRPDTGEAYITGWTRSPDFPTANAIDAVFGDDPSRERAFAAKLSPDGSELLYSTYLGGDASSVRANAIALDSSGAPYVTGAVRDSLDGPSDVFVTKLTPDGSALAYSTRFGGSAQDVAYAIAVDTQGSASVTGATDSYDFPQAGSPQPFSGGFAARLVPDGSGFDYSTFLFGTGTGIAIAEPYTYVTGVMLGRPYDQFSPVGPGGGPTDAFVEVLGSGGQPANFTHLGGTGEDRGSAIGVDFAGNVWVTGVTTSTDFPLVNPLQGRVRDLDAFVVRFNPGLVPLFSTYLGGTGREQLVADIANVPWPPGPALAVDRVGSITYQFGGPPRVSLAFVAGFTDSTDFPTAGFLPATQATLNGAINGFVTWIVDDGAPTKPDLAVTEIGGVPAEVEFGAILHYLLEVTNKGPARARDVTFLDKLPAGAIVGDVAVITPPSTTSYPRSCEHAGMWVACRLWPLSEGESVFIRIDVMAATVGAQINTSAVEDEGVCPPAVCISNAFLNWFNGFTQDLIWGEDAGRDKDIHDNSVTTTTMVTPGSVDLSVAGLASPVVVMLDGTMTYTLDVTNPGSTATAATLTDSLPAGTALISATQTGSAGSCTGTALITCEWPSLSGTARVTIVVRAASPGMLTNTAIVTGASPDPNSTNNAVTLLTRVNRPPTANAGPDQNASAGATCQALVTLSGRGSSDPDGDTLTFAWTIDNQLPPPILFSPVDPSTGMVTGPTITGPVSPGVHTVMLTVTDGVGGASSDTVVVTVRDLTAPTFSGVPAPVTIEQSSPSGAPLAIAMPIGLDNCSGAVAVSSNAPALFAPGATVVTFTATDAAGNSATATTTVTVVDRVAPVLAIASPQARAYLHSDVLTVSLSATDAGSGLGAGMPIARLDGAAVVNGQSISLSTGALGTHNFVLTATDVAGNSRSQSVTFTVIATIDSLIASVNVFAGQHTIDDSSTVKSLLGKLNDAKDLIQRGKKPSAIEKLQGFIDLVTAQRGRHITDDAAQILIADARYLIDTLR